MTYLDIAGAKFGRLIAIEPTERRSGGKVVWRCVCACGSEAFAAVNHLNDGRRVSCGCAKKAGNQLRKKKPKHGHCADYKSTQTYMIWSGMWARCSNPNGPGYRFYGARGIRVCERWRKFENFLVDMGEKPADKSLDRINNDGNYEPGNCRWATDIEQHRNRSDNVRVTFNGETHTIVEWEDRLGMKRGLLRDRIRKGWAAEKALTHPVMTKSEAAIAANKSRWGNQPHRDTASKRNKRGSGIGTNTRRSAQ